MSLATNSSVDLPEPAMDSLTGWELEEAKTKFSEVVRLSRNQAHQRITVRGEDAVVIVSTKEFAKLMPWLQQPNLHALLSQSPLSQIDFEPQRVRSPVRDVEL